MSMRALRADPLAQRRIGMARDRLSGLSADDLAAITSERLVTSYGLTLSEADHLIRSFRRV